MIEGAVVAVVIMLLTAIAVLSAEMLVIVGLSLAVFGMLASLPTGFVYHLRLRTALLARGPLPRRWWWSPVRLHRGLTPVEMAPVRFWFRAGAAGFVVAILGCVLALCAVFKLGVV